VVAQVPRRAATYESVLWLGRNPQMYELASGIIHKHQQSTGLGMVVESAVLAPVDLDQLAIRLAPETRFISWKVQVQTFGAAELSDESFVKF